MLRGIGGGSVSFQVVGVAHVVFGMLSYILNANPKDKCYDCNYSPLADVEYIVLASIKGHCIPFPWQGATSLLPHKHISKFVFDPVVASTMRLTPRSRAVQQEHHQHGSTVCFRREEH